MGGRKGGLDLKELANLGDQIEIFGSRTPHMMMMNASESKIISSNGTMFVGLQHRPLTVEISDGYELGGHSLMGAQIHVRVGRQQMAIGIDEAVSSSGCFVTFYCF